MGENRRKRGRPVGSSSVRSVASQQSPISTNTRRSLAVPLQNATKKKRLNDASLDPEEGFYKNRLKHELGH